MTYKSICILIRGIVAESINSSRLMYPSEWRVSKLSRKRCICWIIRSMSPANLRPVTAKSTSEESTAKLEAWDPYYLTSTGTWGPHYLWWSYFLTSKTSFTIASMIWITASRSFLTESNRLSKLFTVFLTYALTISWNLSSSSEARPYSINKWLSKTPAILFPPGWWCSFEWCGRWLVWCNIWVNSIYLRSSLDRCSGSNRCRWLKFWGSTRPPWERAVTLLFYVSKLAKAAAELATTPLAASYKLVNKSLYVCYPPPRLVELVGSPPIALLPEELFY